MSGDFVSRARWIAGFILGFVLVGAGVMKFADGHVFQYLESQTGLGFLDPYVNWLVGAAEIAAGVMIRFRRTRRYGSLAALAIAGGAVLAHLTPWLGISTPTGFAEGAASPWDRADFTAATSPSLFVIALFTLALALIVASPHVRPRRSSQPSIPFDRFEQAEEAQPVAG